MTGLEALGMLMLVVMLGAIFIGLPISFTLLFLALIFGYFGLGDRVFNLAVPADLRPDEAGRVRRRAAVHLMGYICDQAG
jgi:TRAP-type mannitol/chloroaromatic compound transport system permease large subunit